MRTLFRSALAAAVLALAGCGGGDAPTPDESPAAGLTDYLPAEPFVVAVVDVDEARSELGLEADADATAIERFAEDLEPGDPEYELVQGTARRAPADRLLRPGARERPGDRRPRRHRDLGGRLEPGRPRRPGGRGPDVPGASTSSPRPWPRTATSATATRWSTPRRGVDRGRRRRRRGDRAQRQGRLGRRPGRGAAGRSGGARRGARAVRRSGRGRPRSGSTTVARPPSAAARRADGASGVLRIEPRPARGCGQGRSEAAAERRDRPGGARGRLRRRSRSRSKPTAAPHRGRSTG